MRGILRTRSDFENRLNSTLQLLHPDVHLTIGEIFPI